VKVEPIINNRLKLFKETNALGGVPDHQAFERFVNHTILSSHQPNAFSADAGLLDDVCVGGRDDMGIDGIAIKVNGLLVHSVQDAKDLMAQFKRARLEFIFIQAKQKHNFDSGEFTKFTSGVKDFLSESHLQPMSQSVKAALEIKDYLLSDDVMVIWDDNPSVRLYYVALGKWRDSQHLTALADQFKKDIEDLNTYDKCDVHFVDSESLKDICDNNTNTFSSTIQTIDQMSLTAVPDVESSCIALCYASEFLKMLTTEEGVIRKSLFDDNVRDFQGINSVNCDIERTIMDEPKTFGLLNNGITVVCDEFVTSNRALVLKNPQIVNGCQTNHVLFQAKDKNASLEQVPLQIKVIATKNLNITNQVVRGTNRQNIVYDEAFETTKKFHKDLEEFFNNYTPRGHARLYYERRSKQYQHDPRIKQTERINLRILTQSCIAMFLNKPHMSHRHESLLLREFANALYQENHSMLPYYVTALTFFTLEQFFREREIEKSHYYAFRAHILMLFKVYVSGPYVSLTKEKDIDRQCDKILDTLSDQQLAKKAFESSVRIFNEGRKRWTDDLGKSPSGIKDISEFTSILLRLANDTKMPFSKETEEEDDKFRGRVAKIRLDRNGRYYGFISRRPDDIFFHSGSNRYINFRDLQGKIVSYRVFADPRTAQQSAIDVELEES
jgi:hypothetical protein